MKDSTKGTQIPTLLQALIQLLETHRPAFKQARPYWRAVGMVFAELFTFGRHTIAQGILGLGQTEGDWSGWYRLFSRERFDEAQLSRILVRETVREVPETQPYVVGIDSTQISRSSLKMPGSCWLKSPRSPARREWQAGLAYLDWIRAELDQAGRSEQRILALADGGFDVLALWRQLPERVSLITRTARNRALYWLPQPQSGPGRPASYGDKAPHPADWLHAGLRNWPQPQMLVRGKSIQMRYQLLGPLVRDGLPERPLFLLVVKGMHRLVGKKKLRYKHRELSFYLISAVQEGESWQLPWPIEIILAWLWQRWELEVAHREMKSGLGVGEKQCWNTRSAVVSVQWSVWVYAILVLAGYRTWGLCGGPPTPAPWWPGAKRWSFNTLWRSYRAALWGTAEFRPLWLGTGDNWWKKETWLAGLANSVAASVRI